MVVNKVNIKKILKNKKILVFDFDGVIVNSNSIKTKSFIKLYSNNKNSIKKIINFHEKKTALNRFKKIEYINKNIIKKDFSRDKINEYIMNFNNISETFLKNVKYLPGLLNFLKNNKKGNIFLINSAAPKKELVKFIRNKIIKNYFKGIYGSPQTKLQNFKEIFEKYNKYNVSHFLYFGDSASDYLIAKKYNIDFIGLNFDKMNKLKKFEKQIPVFNDFNFYK